MNALRPSVRLPLFALAAAAALAAFPGRASAALEVTLAPSVQNAGPGAELVFSGTLTNTAASGKLFLNDISAALGGASATALTLQSPAFFSNVPGILLPGESYTGVLFRIALGSAAPAADYSGTITFSGGAGIMDTTALQSTGFTVLSPAVSIAATDPVAGEYGPDTATLTISRTGGTAAPLPVTWSLTGAAAHFQSPATGLTIPAGAASAAIVLTPLANNTAEGDRTLTLTLQPSTSLRTAAPATATVTLHDKPADAWRLEHFGPDANTPAAADTADWDGDGAENFLEYALGLDPVQSSSLALSGGSGAGSLILTYVPNPAAVDVTYVVELSQNLSTWSTSGVESVPPPAGSPAGAVAWRPVPGATPPGPVFLRLRAVR